MVESHPELETNTVGIRKPDMSGFGIVDPVRFSNGPDLKWSRPFKFWTMVRFLNGKDHSLDVSSSLDHLNTKSIEMQPSKCLDFEWSDFGSPL